MRLVNLLFDEEFDDVDIICVPDEIADIIDDIADQFTTWIWTPENCQRFSIPRDDGTPISNFGTDEFLWYLNNIFLPSGQKAEIVIQHAKYRPEYPTANF